MPIPVIVWIGVVAGSAAIGAWKLRDANSTLKSAKKKYARRRKRYEHFIETFDHEHELVGRRLKKLGGLRVNALVTLGAAVRFLEKARLKERDVNTNVHIAPQQMIAWKKASISAQEIVSGLGQTALSGVATASGVYGLVGTLASASTGTAISALSGAAASNATLAWLGGGTIAAGGGGMAAGAMVFEGLVVGPAIAVSGFVAGAKAERLMTEVERHIAELEKDQAEKERVLACLEALKKRIQELNRSTRDVHEELKELLSRCNPSVDGDAYLVAKTASSLGKLLEVAILDNSGHQPQTGGVTWLGASF
jgi:chromosome segregation ATPase